MDPVILFCDEPGAGLDPVTLANLDHLIVPVIRDPAGAVQGVHPQITGVVKPSELMNQGPVRGEPGDLIRPRVCHPHGAIHIVR